MQDSALKMQDNYANMKQNLNQINKDPDNPNQYPILIIEIELEMTIKELKEQIQLYNP